MRIPRLGRTAIALAAVLMVAAPMVARAGEPSEEDLIRQGVERRRHQDDDAALKLFRKAYAIRKSPRAVAQMGLAEMALGRWPEAETHLQEAMEGSSDPWVAKNTATLKNALTNVRSHLGNLQVLGEPAGAEVVLEGEVRGTLPMSAPVRVRVGECRFDVRAQGFETITRTVQINADNLTRETVRLSPVAPMALPAAPNPDTGPSQVAQAPVASPSPGEPETIDDGRMLRTVGISLAAGGVAAVGAGVAFGLVAQSRGDTDSSATMFNASRESSGKQFETLQWVGYGVGAALIAGGAVTYIIGVRREHTPVTVETALAPSFIPTPGGAIAGLVGTL